MRIIGGEHRGRILRPPQGLPVRPTTDLAKESLFNILNNYIDFEEITALDLFAGTGNISLEFASRGAKFVLCVDLNGKCTDYISKTATQFGFDNLSVLRANVMNMLTRNTRMYDIIFADPPYDMPNRDTLPGLILDNGWLAEEGWLIIEHDSRIHFNTHPRFIEERHYGKVHFSFFR